MYNNSRQNLSAPPDKEVALIRPGGLGGPPDQVVIMCGQPR